MAPLAGALSDLVAGRPGLAALLRAGRWDEARTLLSRRLDRRPSPRDELLGRVG